MKLNKKTISEIFLVVAMVLFVITINYNDRQDKSVVKALEGNIDKQVITNSLNSINVEQKKTPIYLKENMSETVACNDVDESINILEYMKDGMENSTIVSYYQEDIQNLMMMTDSKIIEIKYYETDLNDDGKKDLIVSIISLLHLGTQGDSFQILFYDGGKYLKNQISYTFRLYYQNDDYTPGGQVYILSSKTKGYHDLEIFSDGSHFFLKYQSGAYQYIMIIKSKIKLYKT